MRRRFCLRDYVLQSCSPLRETDPQLALETRTTQFISTSCPKKAGMARFGGNISSRKQTPLRLQWPFSIPAQVGSSPCPQILPPPLPSEQLRCASDLKRIKIQYQSKCLNLQYNQSLPMDYDARKDSLQSEQESEQVEIYFSIKHFSAPAVYLEVYLQETNKPKKKLQQTKPATPYHQVFEFPDPLTIQYYFQVRQKIVVEIYSASSYRELLGEASATVGEIFNARNKGMEKDIQTQGVKLGLMNFRGEKVERGSNKYVEFTLIGRNVDVGSYFLCFGEGGAHWKLYKVKNGEDYLLYESEVKEGKNNRYAPMKINEKRLCNNNHKQPIVFRFFSDSGHSLIGEVRTDLESMTRGNLKLTLMKGQAEKGVILLEGFKQSIRHDFTDYLASGMQMAMVVCIDFTASNGIQNQPNSLHFVTPTKKSQYEEALHEVCNIALDYDTDKLVPTFGFGAKVSMPNFSTASKVHHCFPLNGSESNPNLFQLEGIMAGYRAALPSLSFSGPTYFAPLLREAMNVCQGMKNEIKEYMILLILTDGIIHDKEDVKDLLVKCGKLPLSIIIIGIGSGEDWGAMHELDDDDCLMTDYQGNKTQRDLVQFVEFSQHNNNGVELAREVLEELPRQVEEYHQLVGLTPDDYKKNLASDSLFQQERKR